ncbi:MAG: Zn-ribbon domain-containing OB-fold protein, partial [Alphaproteobacteria bacterium]
MADIQHKNNRFQGKGPGARYAEFLARGEFRIQQCTACGHFQFFPRVICTACGAAEPEWVQASGRGTVYSRTLIAQRPEAGGPY